MVLNCNTGRQPKCLKTIIGWRPAYVTKGIPSLTQNYSARREPRFWENRSVRGRAAFLLSKVISFCSHCAGRIWYEMIPIETSVRDTYKDIPPTNCLTIINVFLFCRLKTIHDAVIHNLTETNWSVFFFYQKRNGQNQFPRFLQSAGKLRLGL